MFLVDWAVKMRIRPPEFETSICDAKYHVSLSTHSAAPLSSLAAAVVGHHAAAAAPRRSCSGQLFEEFSSALISSSILVQADEEVSLPVVDLIDESTAAYREEPVFL
ncbi:hypothetical protein F511_11254 [Dorcoceras hygrometricum]|uniref:Uncharacterized protein n=1 Tax=Dorcoceras hygrometricum TaxID=472368 RepID=A0A2Z7DCN3_9LAMI|nr:hypothetical protein F511_11254 [Dorcoceras hygrometricum]